VILSQGIITRVRDLVPIDPACTRGEPWHEVRFENILPKYSLCEFRPVELWRNIDMELLLTYQASQSCKVRSVINPTVIIKINFAKIMVLIGLRACRTIRALPVGDRKM
jgi:hypothetical protein